MAAQGSGGKIVKITTRERLSSSDSMRAQQFRASELADFLAHVFLTQTEDDLECNGVPTYHTTTEDPLTAVVLNGLTFVPTIGTATGVIQSGMVIMSNPDGSPDPDDSARKLVVMPDAASPTLTPNVSGSTRIDVLEATRTVANVETAIRDVFDNANGTFTPTSLTKVLGSQLTYRIRTGTPGAGWPGTASGYMPIAVISVPDGASVWDDCTIWDVRPLAAELVRSPFQASYDLTAQKRNNFLLTTGNTRTQLYPGGYCEPQLGAWRP